MAGNLIRAAMIRLFLILSLMCGAVSASPARYVLVVVGDDGIVRRWLVPDSDDELADPSFVFPGEQPILIPMPTYRNMQGLPDIQKYVDENRR